MYPRSHEPDLNTLHTFLSMARIEGSARTLQVCGYVLRLSPLTRMGRRRRWLRPRRWWPQGILGVKFGWPRLDALPIGDELNLFSLRVEARDGYSRVFELFGYTTSVDFAQFNYGADVHSGHVVRTVL